MSIATEITRLTNAKAAIKTAIENKGVIVPSSDTLDNYAGHIDAIQQGGEKTVIFIDDAAQEVCYEYTAEQFLALTEMPPNPTHTGLVSQGWNWTLADAKAYVQSYGALTIGQMYTTSTGETLITINTNYWADLNSFLVYVYQSKVNGTTIDFGDNTAIERFASKGLANVSHQYAQHGIYTIKILPDSDCEIRLGYCVWSAEGYFVKEASIFGYDYHTKNLSRPNAITRVHIGDRVTNTGCIGKTNLVCATMPSTVTRIGASYPYSQLKCATYPNAISVLDDLSWQNSGFYYCPNLQYVSLPKMLPNLEQAMFEGCHALEQVTLPTNLTTLPTRLFYLCNNLKVLAMPCSNIAGDLTASVFVNCDSLLKIDLAASSVTTFGGSFALNCFNMKELKLPNTLTSIGTGSSTSQFGECHSLEEINIPSEVTVIPNNAFTNCYSAKKIMMGNKVTAIGVSAFQYAHVCKTLKLSTTLQTIGNYAFRGFYQLKELILPDTLTTIGNSAFEGYLSLEELIIPDSVTSMGTGCFQYCQALKSLTLSQNCTTIPQDCFFYCYFLTEVVVPEGVTTIGAAAFDQYGSNSMKRIVLPSTITTIGANAFRIGSNHEALFDSVCEGIWVYAITPPTITSNSFANHTCPIYIPNGTLAAYQTASNWSAMASRFVEMPATE